MQRKSNRCLLGKQIGENNFTNYLSVSGRINTQHELRPKILMKADIG